MSRAAVVLAAVGFLALLAWLTLRDPEITNGPGDRPADRASRGGEVVVPPVAVPEPAPQKPAPEPTVRPAGAIEGTVVDPAGIPRPGAVIRVNVDGRVIATATADDSGRFRIPTAAGEVTVVVTADTYLAHAVRITAPADLGTIRLSRGFSIRGRVVDAGGEGVPGVSVMTGDVTLATVKTDDEGRFLLSGMPKEPLLLYARALEVTMAGEAPEVTPPAHGVTIVVKRLRLGFGTVTAEDDGKPVAGATVRLTLSLGGWSQVEADAKGRFAFDLTDERYSDPRLRFTVLVTAGGFEDATVEALTLEQVRPHASLAVKLIRAVIVEPGRLRGRVLYDTGDPFHGALTLSFSREGRAGEIFRIETNEKGEFLVEKVPPGEYVLRTAPHGESILRETGKTLVIPPGGEETTEFTLTRGGDVSVKITGEDGAALADVDVVVIDEDGAEQRRFHIPDGAGIVPDLPPGQVRIRVTKAGYGTTESEVTVVKDQVTDLAVRLSETR